MARQDARLARSHFTKEEQHKQKERLLDLLGAENTGVRILKDLSWVHEHMRRSGFADPVEWLISEGNMIPPPPGFGRSRPREALWRKELHQLYRDKVKEVVRYWREKGFL